MNHCINSIRIGIKGEITLEKKFGLLKIFFLWAKLILLFESLWIFFLKGLNLSSDGGINEPILRLYTISERNFIKSFFADFKYCRRFFSSKCWSISKSGMNFFMVCLIVYEALKTLPLDRRQEKLKSVSGSLDVVMDGCPLKAFYRAFLCSANMRQPSA